jgi:uncharacterized protein
MRLRSVFLLSLLPFAASSAREIRPLADKTSLKAPDRQAFQTPDRVHLTGWLGERIAANESNRLTKLDPARLLEGYRKRPGRQAWDGEHVGKWLHAATLAWANTGDPALREKLDYTVRELLKCQLDDGYLGTYLERDRWSEWDVWAHKYNLIGLITYMRFTGNTEPLPACRRMADMLCRTFGDEPGQRDIIRAGHHVGLAPTSVLEPMVLLYRLTGELRYLDFCKYILRSWEQPNGPKVISTLLTRKRVDKVGNGKAYEMLSCLNGVLEYYRTVGDPQLLQACLIAWQDIADKRLYLTGAASYGELFHDDYDLPNLNNVGETCVTVTWIQFNAQLLRLTGEARFADQLERVVLNQLLGAQKCDGSAWGYYVQMEGKKPYSSTLDGHCCLSSGPRGVALIPTFAATTDADGVVVNLFDAGTASLSLRDDRTVTLTTETHYPAEGRIRIRVVPSTAATFSLKLRLPPWSENAALRVNGNRTPTVKGADGYVTIRRAWKRDDLIELAFELKAQVVIGDHLNQGKIAVLYGPLVLTADAALLPQLPGTTPERPLPLSAIAAPGLTLSALNLKPESAPPELKFWSGAQLFRMNAVLRRTFANTRRGTPIQIRLVPFADAGETGSEYRVWIPLPVSRANGNVLLDSNESRSREGNVSGSVNDDSAQSFVVTFDGGPAAEDWFAVVLDEPVSVNRLVFVQGRLFHDGGWFDASAGKPCFQAQLQQNGTWQKLAVLEQYPGTTETNPMGLKEGDRFQCRLAEPLKIWGLRVVGKPACGDNPQQAFSSCAELQAFSP